MIGAAFTAGRSGPYHRALDREVSKDTLLVFMDGKVAKWWMPDDATAVNEIPHTATGARY